jgi:hypothetical protein
MTVVVRAAVSMPLDSPGIVMAVLNRVPFQTSVCRA